jgi:NitT/TauT family transport system permease protein
MVLCLSLLLWHVSTARGWIDPFFVSTPATTITFLIAYLFSGMAWAHIATTVYETVAGFALGALSGVLMGLVLCRFRLLDEILSPFLTALNALPRVALAPMFVLWFGIGPASKIYLAISVVFFIVMINTQAGVRSVDPDLLTIARAMGANERQRFLKVVLPGSVPAIFAGLRLGAVYALLAVVVGEMLAAKLGLGQEISLYAGTFQAAGVFAALFILAVIALSLNALSGRVEAHLMRWRTPSS